MQWKILEELKYTENSFVGRKRKERKLMTTKKDGKCLNRDFFLFFYNDLSCPQPPPPSSKQILAHP